MLLTVGLAAVEAGLSLLPGRDGGDRRSQLRPTAQQREQQRRRQDRHEHHPAGRRRSHRPVGSPTAKGKDIVFQGHSVKAILRAAR